MTDIVERLHDCKRGLSTATSEDYNNWWREIERLRDTLRITDPNDLLGRLQAAEADLAEAETLLSEAHVMQWKHDSVYAEWRNRIDAFLARRGET